MISLTVILENDLCVVSSFNVSAKVFLYYKKLLRLL